MVVVDEAHHLYRNAEARELIAEFTTAGTEQLLLLSDISQSIGSDIEFPLGLDPIVLSEVVRNSRRIVQAAAAFQIGGEAKVDTLCHHQSDGPPLKVRYWCRP